jgi:peptide/nickel transport system substrate-binding protein
VDANDKIAAWYKDFRMRPRTTPCSKGLGVPVLIRSRTTAPGFRWAIALAMNFDESREHL